MKKIKGRRKVIRVKEDNKYYFMLSEVIMFSLVSVFFGIIVGLLISYSKYMLFDSSDKKVNEIVSTYNNIVNSYYDNVNKDKLVNGAINGMINSLEDPNSLYLDKETSNSFNQNMDGYYEGVGISVTYIGGNCAVYEVFKGSSADRVGLKKGDILIEINGTNVEDYSMDEITRLIKDSPSSVIRMTIKRDGKKKKFVLKRGRVELSSVSKKVIDKNIGYIKISTFATNTASQFNNNLKSLEKKNIKSLIIDLRDNPGGHLNQVDDMLDLFFKKNTVLYQVEVNKKITDIKAKSNITRNYPVVILINENSASASEIIASCFKENYKNIKLIGHNSFGKGTVQKEVKLSTGSSIKYTTEKWLTSKGKWLNNDTTGGLKVDILVDNEEDKDNQLTKAVEEIKKSS